MIRQPRLSGFFNKEEPKIVQSAEYQFDDPNKITADTSRHREQINRFDRFANKSSNDQYSIYTHEQLSSLLESEYQVQGQQLINLCLESKTILAAGGKRFVTRYSRNEIFDRLNQENPGLRLIAEQAKQSQSTSNNREQATEQYQRQLQAQDRFAQRSKRSGSLTTDDLRKIPSYSFCLHPDIKSALNRLEREIEAAKSSGVVNTRLASEWEAEISNIHSERDYDQVVRKVKAYLGK